jgi:hypothetical protein
VYIIPNAYPESPPSSVRSINYWRVERENDDDDDDELLLNAHAQAVSIESEYEKIQDDQQLIDSYLQRRLSIKYVRLL